MKSKKKDSKQQTEDKQGQSSDDGMGNEGQDLLDPQWGHNVAAVIKAKGHKTMDTCIGRFHFFIGHESP